jgi:hypothetical protein
VGSTREGRLVRRVAALRDHPWTPPPPTARVTFAGPLLLHLTGAHAEEVRSGSNYEDDRGNHAALRLAELGCRRQEDPEPLREEARRSGRAGAADLRRRRRAALPETEAAGEARDLLREELAKATPQRITIRSGFLLENPQVAGARGLGISPELLDSSYRN